MPYRVVFVAFIAVLIALLVIATISCSGSKKGNIGSTQLVSDIPATHLLDAAEDEGARQIPGTPSLVQGASNTPNPEQYDQASREPSVAGVDFASNRFVVIFENNPDPDVLAPYLINTTGNGDDSDVIRTTDNKPLVQHEFFRKVSANLAAKYGLEIFTRVFYKDINFVAYKVAVDNVGELDSIMLKVLRENKGLVREVHYDVFLQATGVITLTENRDEACARHANNPDNPTGFKYLPKPIDDFIISSSSLNNSNNIDSFINYINPSGIFRSTSAAPDDPMHLNKSGTNGGTWANWRVRAVDTCEGADGAWKNTTGATDIVIAVIDTGVRYTHEDLSGIVINPSTTPPYNEPGILTDVINKDNNPIDDHGHGTLCSGSIGAHGNNAKGLSGMNQTSTILPIKVLSGSGYGTDAQVAEGMLLADYLGANILSLSLSGPFQDRTTQLAVEQCWADGMLVVIAASNDNTDAPGYPAYYPDALAVGATTLVNATNDTDFTLVDGVLPVATRYDARASFSNYGDWVDIAAPGVEVRTCSNSSDTSYVASVAGTSLACPYVAGCAALLWDYVRDEGGTPTNTLIRSLLQGSGTDLALCNQSNPKGFKDNTSNGAVVFCNVKAAMDLYDAGGGSGDADITWDNPVDDDSVTGTEEIRVSVSGNSGNITKVEFETPTRHLGSTTSLDDGFYKLNWDTVFEFNKALDLTAIVWDDDGNRYESTITVTPNNAHESVNFLEDFTDIANNAIPTGWFKFDGNKGSSNTAWGAGTAYYHTASPGMHSSGTTADYAASSNDWLFAPIIDLSNQAAAELSFWRRYQMGSGDEGYLLITNDDMTYAYAEFLETTLQDWTEHTFDLSIFAGQEVRILWVLQANGSGQSSGLWLDDVAVTGTSGTPPSISITSPSNGAQVNGRVQVDLSVEGVDRYRVYAVPPSFGGYLTYDIETTDTTTSFYWDSRYIYNGGALLKVLAFDNDTEDGLVASDTVALSINNTLRNPNHFDGFESITTLGGYSGSNFDGDWYVWNGGASADKWRIWETSPYAGTKCAKFGPDGSGNYTINNSDRLYGPVHHPSSTGHPFIRFFHKLDLGTGDVAKVVLVRYDGLNETEVILGEYRSDVSSWTEVKYDLTDYRNDDFRLLFYFTSNDDATVGTGWLIDNYEIINANPVINDIDDPRGAPGKSVTINGSGFGPYSNLGSVTFAKDGGGRTTAAVDSWTASAIDIDVPSDAVSGDVIVTVLGYTSAGEYFGVTLPPPNLTGLNENR